MTLPIPSLAPTTAQSASQASEGTNILPSTVALGHDTTSSTTGSPKSTSKALSNNDSATAATQLQEIEQNIQELNTKLKLLRTKREELESGSTEEQHKEAMSILEQEQILERKIKELMFRQKQITSKQTNPGLTKQQSVESAILQNQPANKCFKLALRLRYVCNKQFICT